MEPGEGREVRLKLQWRGREMTEAFLVPQRSMRPSGPEEVDWLIKHQSGL
jgi:hypothetical protein